MVRARQVATLMVFNLLCTRVLIQVTWPWSTQQTRTSTAQDGPNHLGLLSTEFHRTKMAPITSGLL